MKLFGTSGIRGPSETLFTNDFCFRLGFVYGSWLKNHGKRGYVAVANDPRESSPRIKRAVSQGLSVAGWELLDEGVIPTPALTLFSKNTPHVGGAVMITGSHITADLNGVKLLVDGEEVTKEHEREIENLFASLKPPRKSADPIVRFENKAKDQYIDMLKNLASLPYPNWKIIVDTANGTQTQIIRDLMPDLGLDYTCTDYCDIQSPNFIPRDTEVESHFFDLIKTVLKTGADLGIGFDADGDRVIFIDNTGRFIPGDYSCSFIAKHSKPTCIVTPVSCSSVVDQLGIPSFHTPVGSTHVAAVMKAKGCNFGFEANGGALSAEIIYGRDGGSTMIKFLNCLKSTGLSSSEAYDSLPKYSLFRQKTDCPFNLYPVVYQAVKQKFSSNQVDETDGIKVIFSENEWVLFRGSGNAPEFRVFAQSPNSKTADKLGHEGISLVKSTASPANSTRQYPTDYQDSLQVLKSIESFPDQCRQVISDVASLAIPKDYSLVKNIVLSGMGGSALGGRIIAALERETLKIPIMVSTEYHLPNFVDKNSLVIVSSYSGNTEETLAALEEARARGAQIFCVASGGKLAELAKEYNLPAYLFDSRHNPSAQPRMGLGYNVLALIELLVRCRLIHSPENLNRLYDYLKSAQSDQSRLTALARKLANKIPVLISSEHLKGAVHSIKNQLNENSKTFAVMFDLPEANHHLLEGLSFPLANFQNLAFVFFESGFYHPELKKSYPVTKRIVERNRLQVTTYKVTGPSRLFEVMELIQAGAYLSYHLAQVNGVDPGPTPWVDWYKDEVRKVV